jgi:hypothetical protein
MLASSYTSSVILPFCGLDCNRDEFRVRLVSYQERNCQRVKFSLQIVVEQNKMAPRQPTVGREKATCLSTGRLARGHHF